MDIMAFGIVFSTLQQSAKVPRATLRRNRWRTMRRLQPDDRQFEELDGEPNRSLRFVANQGVALADPHNISFDFIDEIQGLTNHPDAPGAPNKIVGVAGTPPDNKECLSTSTAYAPSATGASLTEDRP